MRKEVILYNVCSEYGNKHNVTELVQYCFSLHVSVSLSHTHYSVQAAVCDARHSSGMRRALNLTSYRHTLHDLSVISDSHAFLTL